MSEPKRDSKQTVEQLLEQLMAIEPTLVDYVKMQTHRRMGDAPGSANKSLSVNIQSDGGVTLDVEGTKVTFLPEGKNPLSSPVRACLVALAALIKHSNKTRKQHH